MEKKKKKKKKKTCFFLVQSPNLHEGHKMLGAKNATIQQLTTKLSTSENVLFPGHIHQC